MVTPELIKYLEECERQGVKKEQAMTALLAAGWKLPHIQEGFKIVSARSTPLSRPKIMLPALRLSVSFLTLVVIGTGATVLTLDYAKQAPLGGGLEANIVSGVIKNETETESTMIQDQINKISEITDAIQIYHELAGTYPSNLEDLKKSGKEIIGVASSTTIPEHDLQYLMGLYGDRPLYTKDFTDVFAKTSFLYGPTAEDFSLSYLLRWNNPQSSVIEEQFVNGWNTATAESLSAFRYE